MSYDLYHSFPNDPAVLKIPALGLDLLVRLPPEVTGHELTIIETTNAPGFGPPLHRHRETEIFRVLEGTYLYEVDGQRFEVAEGEVVSVPGGAAHTFLNITDKPARQYIIITPGMDARAFFSSLGDLFAQGRPTIVALNTFGKPWGMEFLGPPLSLQQ